MSLLYACELCSSINSHYSQQLKKTYIFMDKFHLPIYNKGRVLQGFGCSNETLQQGRISVKFIECDKKFKSVMNEVSYEMGIEKNYSNIDNHVPETERNNRVIK